MHVELVVPALFSAAPAHASPALELLLARGRRVHAERSSLEDWLVRAFGLEGPAPAGALTALACNEDPGGKAWLRADPVHLRADRDHAVLVPNEAFTLSMEEAQALASALTPLLEGRYTLHALRPDQWCLSGDRLEGAGTRAPIDLAGADVDSNLPARHWHTLLTEIQMALYDHPVNTERERRRQPVVNSLWLWGAGALPAAAKGPWHSLSADHLVALGLARLAQVRHRSLGAGAAGWLERAPEDGRHLLVLDARRSSALEEHWFAPLLAALKSRRIGMATVHVPDAGLSVETTRVDLHRFWRRPRPLAAWADA